MYGKGETHFNSNGGQEFFSYCIIYSWLSFDER